MKNKFLVNDIVTPATESDVRSLQHVFRTKITLETRFLVAVVVEKGLTYKGKESGLIILHESTTLRMKDPAYPYVWDVKRFLRA
jgi:hypothetical protein